MDQGRRTPFRRNRRAGPNAALELVSVRGTTTSMTSPATGASHVSEGLKRVYGIDLGTTYSAIAYVDEHGKPVVVPNQESERITPSVVLFDGDNIIVGNTAKESAKVEPHRVVSRIKQHMGDPNFVFQYEGQTFGPEDISSFILRKVVGDAADRHRGEDHRRRHHLPGLFRHARARRPPTPAGWPVSTSGRSSTSRPRRPSPTGWNRAKTRPCWFTTWAAARSTSP